jgi:hypothetical protein
MLKMHHQFGFYGGNMKIVTLCKEGSCCPVVKVSDDKVEIGEKGNLCILTIEQWQMLRDKIINKEL